MWRSGPVQGADFSPWALLGSWKYGCKVYLTFQCCSGEPTQTEHCAPANTRSGTHRRESVEPVAGARLPEGNLKGAI